ncbi:hypothetical protein [Variovorax sp. LjRoot178]|uniref:hypothetical protein n=1 Tax=Variovorax sp. LjRoot178 TaxID=3342277 RepID=UPI003ECC58B1
MTLALAATPHTAGPTPAENARRVLAQTASVWRIAPASPREVARRAPHGYVPVRVLRRNRAAAVASLAHSW